MARALVVAVALLGCGGATPRQPPLSPEASVFRIELAASGGAPSSSRSAACQRALDALGERLGRHGRSAPDELAAVQRACPRADGAAAEELLDGREGSFLGGPAGLDDDERVRQAIMECTDCSDGFESACQRGVAERSFARVALRRLEDGGDPWLGAQRCAAALVPRRARAVTLERTRAWAAAGQPEPLARCLDGCALDGAARAELARMEKGDGYERRIRAELDGADAAITHLHGAGEAVAITASLAAVRTDLTAHRAALGPRATPLDGRVTESERRLAGRLPGVTEVELLNLNMRESNALDVLEKLIPDPIDVPATREEIAGSRAYLDKMRGAVAAAGVALASAPDWTAQINALERRHKAASDRLEVRMQRRLAGMAVMAQICKLAPHAPPAERRALNARLRATKTRFNPRRDCAAKP